MSSIVGQLVEPYATALMSVAKSNNVTEDFGNQMRSLIDLLKNSPELQDFLGSPVVKGEDKKAVITRMLGEEVHPYLRNFLMLLVDRGRIIFLAEIAQEYLALLRKLNQTVLAEVTSAVELNDGQKHMVIEQIKARTGAQNVELDLKIDRDILGGVIIKAGSQLFDASIRGQLRRIGMSLTVG